MRVVSTSIERGDTGSVFIYIANTEELGGYTIRLEFDTTLINVIRKAPNKPVVEAEQLRGNFSTFAFANRSGGVVTGVAIPFSPSESLYPGHGVTIKLLFEARYDAPVGSVASIAFVNDPDEPNAYNMFSELNGLYSIRPVLVHGTVTLGEVTTFEIYCPPDFQLDCNDDTDPFNTGDAYANDPLAIISYSDIETSGSCPGNYSIERTWEAVSGSAAATCTQLITVEDDTPPSLSCPEDAIIGYDDLFTPDDLGYATGDDNCDEFVEISYSDSEGRAYSPFLRTIYRLWLAVDDCGNIEQCTQSIYRLTEDFELIITCPSDTIISCDDSGDPSNTGTAEVNYRNPPFYPGENNPDYNDEIIEEHCAGQYSIGRRWKAVLADEVDSCIQFITVIDTTPPVMTCPSDIELVDAFDISPDVTGYAVAEDNCSDSIVLTYDDQVYTTLADETWSITRTWVAADDCGNTVSCVQQIDQDTDSIGNGYEPSLIGPNPFYSGDGRETCFQVAIPQHGPIRISFLDVVGRRMKILALDNAPAGVNQICWDGRDADGNYVPSGIYLCLLEYAGKSKMLKLAVMRQ